MANDIRCNECRRCVWDPVGGGFVLCCYGNDIQVRVHHSKKNSFLVKECQIALEKYEEESAPIEIMERAHRQYSGMPKRQSQLEMFF